MSRSQNEDLATEGPHRRLRCACCGCPTLNGPTLEVHGADLWPQSCVLCDWENTGPHQSSGTDDELSLDQARANFQRFSWMYDPSALPEWLPSRPSNDELNARARLRQAYSDIDRNRNASLGAELWEKAIDAEERLRLIVDARVAGDVDEAEADARSDQADGAEDDPDETDDIGDIADVAGVALGEDDQTADSTPEQIAASPSSTVDRQLGPFDYPGPPRGTAVVAGLSSSIDEATIVRIVGALQQQPVLLYGCGYVAEHGAPHVIAVLPVNAPADAAESVRQSLLRQPGVLGAFIDRREGAAPA